MVWHPKSQLWAAAMLLSLLIANVVVMFYLSQRGNRYASDTLAFNVAASDPVALFIGEGSHYDLFTDQGTLEYAKLLPSGGHVVHLGDSNGVTRPYTVTLFHQLKCLGILRHEHNSPNSEPLSHHCLTYLRQTILCRPNLRLESVRNPVGSASRGYDTVCPRDWTRIYEAAEENYANYATKIGDKPT